MRAVPALGMGKDAAKAFIEPFELEQSTPKRDTQGKKVRPPRCGYQKIGLSIRSASGGKKPDEEMWEESKEGGLLCRRGRRRRNGS